MVVEANAAGRMMVAGIRIQNCCSFFSLFASLQLLGNLEPGMVPIQTNTFCRGWNGSWIGFEADQDRVKEGDSLNRGPEPFLDGNGSKINERGLIVCKTEKKTFDS
jgi:hypothetical protein